MQTLQPSMVGSGWDVGSDDDPLLGLEINFPSET